MTCFPVFFFLLVFLVDKHASPYPTRRKRDAGGKKKELQQERHKSSEKKRRSEMNDLIENLRESLPLADKDGKLTKSDILRETVDYIERIQRLCEDLLLQNKQLSEQLTTLKGDLSSERTLGREPSSYNTTTVHMASATPPPAPVLSSVSPSLPTGRMITERSLSNRKDNIYSASVDPLLASRRSSGRHRSEWNLARPMFVS